MRVQQHLHLALQALQWRGAGSGRTGGGLDLRGHPAFHVAATDAIERGFADDYLPSDQVTQGEGKAKPLFIHGERNDQAASARELITAYIGAQPLPGDEPDSFPDVLVC